MAKVIYTARAIVRGGREQGHGVTDDGNLDVQLRHPTERGGPGGATNPEQLFAVGYAACFEGALGVVARRMRSDLGDLSIASSVSLIARDDGAFSIAVALDVTMPGISDGDQALQIIAAAHQICPYSNATRGNIEVLLSANGRTLS